MLPISSFHRRGVSGNHVHPGSRPGMALLAVTGAGPAIRVSAGSRAPRSGGRTDRRRAGEQPPRVCRLAGGSGRENRPAARGGSANCRERTRSDRASTRPASVPSAHNFRRGEPRQRFCRCGTHRVSRARPGRRGRAFPGAGSVVPSGDSGRSAATAGAESEEGEALRGSAFGLRSTGATEEHRDRRRSG